ncbi:hypothetical protein Clacol_006154 [Clathrus columnatus]|uniref:DUF7918 domain-containing protein n=1 Tax=Clathrus columnatus TaxID=1419009 RepID=A0AAV5AHF4_9AGAM|nr:hypothetical protein Clacol_006154 [Clathrus columnatus]
MENTTECLKIPGYEFWIESDGKRLEQYDQTREINELGGTVISCYVASKVGKDELAEVRSVPKNLGIIKLEIFRIKNIREEPLKPRPYYQPNTLNVSTLSEKAKTVSLHTISLLEPDTTKEERRQWCRNYDYFDLPKKTPWYTVKFLYRPLDILQAEGIAPRLPLNPISNSTHGRIEKRIDGPSLTKAEPDRDRKPSIVSIKTEDLKVNNPKMAKLDDPVIIEDSDEEDSKHFLKTTLHKYENIKTEELFLPPKRLRETSNAEARRNKRIKKVLDPVVIVLDSD